MNNIVYFDLEVSNNGKILDIGAVNQNGKTLAHLQSSVFKLSKDLIDSIHEEGIVAYTS